MQKWLLASLLVLITACSYVSPETYGRLDVGMTMEDVEGILGNPTHCENRLGARECVWKKGGREIRVSYVDGRVVVFSQSGLEE